MLPITTVRLIIYLVKITVQFSGWGGYFFVVLLPLEPIAYPRPNEVKQRLSTAIKVSTVSISVNFHKKLTLVTRFRTVNLVTL